MKIVSFIATAFLSFFGAVSHAQPDPAQFSNKKIYVHVDSGAYTSYTRFICMEDSIRILNALYDEVSATQSGNTFDAKKVVSISLSAIQPNTDFFSFHYFNSRQKDVFVYLKISSVVSELFEFGRDDGVIIEPLDLRSGTYLVDWSASQTADFQKKVLQNYRKRKIQMEREVTAVNLSSSVDKLNYFLGNAKTLEHSRDSVAFYREEINIKKDKIAVIKNNFFNDNAKFLGYYSVSGDDEPDLAERLPSPRVRYTATLVIPEKTVMLQRISHEVVSPEELTRYIRNAQIKKTGAVKILFTALITTK